MKSKITKLKRIIKENLFSQTNITCKISKCYYNRKTQCQKPSIIISEKGKCINTIFQTDLVFNPKSKNYTTLKPKYRR